MQHILNVKIVIHHHYYHSKGEKLLLTNKKTKMMYLYLYTQSIYYLTYKPLKKDINGNHTEETLHNFVSFRKKSMKHAMQLMESVYTLIVYMTKHINKYKIW